ncbi:MAG: ATP-dependent DNA helicase PcrA [candidate division CPR1 bacterium GW2011_GWA2_42_17]|uniref:DNA 3'-5' helicase n=1 Tax=candidate division CPR1 bacterium GW2011_GWA2_42_17 TaxID=1618341 RepID=A0A0G1C4Q9_9BACT|nr:MAG: ATP-dependent DNA helicase PcrA [candidate division CPR1 bacterium GW2011_GWA2_42_17]
MSINKDDLVKHLNSEQKEAVVAPAGPILVVAGAGSGKTKVLTHRAAFLMSEGVDPAGILAVTFTNKAAEEMRERIGSLLGMKNFSQKMRFSKSLPWVGTFHSFCASVLREDIEKLGYPSNFVIYNDQDQTALIKEAIDKLGMKDENIDAWRAKDVISRAKNDLLDPENFAASAQTYAQRKISQIYDFYQKKLKENRSLDFDDLLLLGLRVLSQYPEVLKKWQEKFQHILVDEYQDTNAAQYNIVKLLAGRKKNVFVVGDIDQSIYSWRGADFRNILQFEQDFPEAKIVKLEENYRSTQNILEAANFLIEKNINRQEKKLWTKNEAGPLIKLTHVTNEKMEASFVVDEIMRLKNEDKVKLDDIAVLYRTNAQSRIMEEYLIEAGIAYQLIGAFRFFERKEIKDILAWARFVFNTADSVSLKRVLESIPLGLGSARVEDVTGFLDEKNLNGGENMAADKNSRRDRALTNFKNLILDLKKDLAKDQPSVFLEKIARKSGYLKRLESLKNEESQSRLENIKELFGLAKSFDEFGVADGILMFFEHVSLMSAQDEIQKGEKVSLMTMHAAKGLEYKVVFMVGMEEGMFPHDRSSANSDALEEERRLCYVGVTRAKKLLYLVNARKRFIFGSTYAHLPSRFIYEIPERLLEFTDLTDEDDVKTVYLDF